MLISWIPVLIFFGVLFFIFNLIALYCYFPESNASQEPKVASDIHHERALVEEVGLQEEQKPFTARQAA